MSDPADPADPAHTADTDDTDDPVADLAVAVMNGTPTAADAGEALRILALGVRRISAELRDDEAQDLVSEALARVARPAGGRPRMADRGRSAHAAYLYTTLRRVVLDHHRDARRSVEVSVGELPVDEVDQVDGDDVVAAGLYRAATAASVRAALVRARAAGDDTAFQVGTYLLDALQDGGRCPSRRHTGDALGISHTAVGKALGRMRGYFDPQAA